MSTTVTYKGNTLTTATDQTRTLKTAGKYMQGDIIITDITAASYTATITGNGNQYGRYVQYDSIKYYTNGDSFVIKGGEDLYIKVEASVTNMAFIYVNDEVVVQKTDGSTATYTYTLPEDNITVDVGTVGVIRVNSESGGESGGGGSSYTPISVGTLEVEANYTSTSAGVITYDLSIDPSGLTANDLLYIKIRDKAGKRNGYFYGGDQYYIWESINNTYLSSRAYRYNNNTLSSYPSGGTTGYGVYLDGIDSTGALTVRGRYSSSYSLTINGTYSIDIYKLEWPDNISPFD